MILQLVCRMASGVLCLALLVEGLGAQGKMPSAPLTVNESSARATLLNNAIELKLPFSVPAPSAAHLVAQLLAPTNIASGEIATMIPPGSRSAIFTFSWPKNPDNSAVEEIGWYRIGYRIEVTGTASTQGILSIGAITPNLLALRLARPRALITGVSFSVRVFAGNPVTRQPFRGVRLKATLNLDNDSERNSGSVLPVVRYATTSANGEAVLIFPGPSRPGESGSLKIEGTLTGPRGGATSAFARATVTSDLEARDHTVFHTATDKPLHKPGETVHLRTLVLNDSGRVAAKVPLTLTIKDPENKTLIETALRTNEFGIASYDWKTTPQTQTGNYDVNFDEDDTSDYGDNGDITIPIKRYELPEFGLTAVMDHSYYLAGQIPVVKIHAGYLFGKPVASGSIAITRSEGVGWYPHAKHTHESGETVASGSLDANGDASFPIDVKADFADFRGQQYERFRDLQFRAVVTDASTRRSEPRNFTVRISHDPVHIYVGQPEGDTHEGDVLVSTSYADGTPVGCKIELDWMDEHSNATRAATAATNQYGLAKVHLRYPAAAANNDSPEFSLRVTARDSEKRVSSFDDTLRPDTSDGLWISVARSLIRPGEPIEATVHGAEGELVDVDVLSETEVLSHLQVRMHHKVEAVNLPGDPRFYGLISIRAYRLNKDDPSYESWSRVTGTKTVLYPEDRELRLKAVGIKPSYLPGAKVAAGLRLSDGTQAAVRGAIGVTVFDIAVAQRADTEEDANDSWFSATRWSSGPEAGGITLADLNKVNTSEPIPDDLELAAEAVLTNESRDPVEIEGTSDASIRSEYEHQMQRDLKPLGAAIDAVPMPHLPRTFEAMQQIARAAHLDPALLDPWNTPYKVEASDEVTREFVRFQSAGPDKRFGTDDDLEIEVDQRNLFAVPGAQLSAFLTKAAASGAALPQNFEQLKAFAQAGGLDLSSAAAGTRTPDGQPYRYLIDIHKCFYTIQVNRALDIEVWRSPSIDYFSSMETRMDAALRARNNTHKGFPGTEAEARQAFETAGIDFNALRDPLGHSFELHVTQLMAYTTRQQVKAGTGLQVNTKAVTQLMRAIQILRRADATSGDSSPSEEIVAQFLYPLNEQSGSDQRPQATSQGTFKGNTGAIGGIVTDQTGAVIPHAVATIRNADGTTSSATTDNDGTYLIADLAPGIYRLNVDAPGFHSFQVYEIRVSAVSLTTVDVELRVGSNAETVTVEASSLPLMSTSSAQLVATSRGVMGAERKTVVTGASGRATISEPAFTPRLRHVFDETAYWAPSLETSTHGRASLGFQLPDSLTNWKLHALASTIDGRTGSLDETFKTFQPFFVDLDAPQVLTQGDEIALPVNLRNYTARELTLPVMVKTAGWFQLSTSTTQLVSIPANASAPINLGLRATATVDEGPLQIVAANAHEGDAVEKKIRVHPDGLPGSMNASSLLRGASTTLSVELPPDLIAGSMHAQLLLYPNLGTQLVHSMKASLERPYGCGEQTISSTYPSLLFLELLKEAKVNSDLAPKAQEYLELGYDRLQSYFDPGGGLTYWGGNDHNPDPALTAYGVEFLLEARPFVHIDQARILSAMRWLLSVQQSDGSWSAHYGGPTAELTLYIAHALVRSVDVLASDTSKDLREQAQSASVRALEWANHSAGALHDPYVNAVRLEVAASTSDPVNIAKSHDELIGSVDHDRDGAHWSRFRSSPFYGWGRAGDLETTALAFSALEMHPSSADRSLLNEVLYYLLHSRDNFGIWYSGQATTRVVKALLPVVIQQLQAPSSAGEYALAVNGNPLSANFQAALHADSRLLDAPRSIDLTAFLKPGHNELVFSGSDDSTLASAEISTNFYTPWSTQSAEQTTKTKTGKQYGLDFGYRCNATNTKVGQPIECTVDARRFGSQSYGMLLAEVGLPPGADLDRTSLSKLLDDWTISRYELQPDRIVFYLWPWRADGIHFTFRFTPRYAIHAKSEPATLSDYYNPDLHIVLAPYSFEVKDASGLQAAF